MKRTVVLAVVLIGASIAYASKIKPLEHKKLNEISPIVLVGTVEKIEKKEPVGGAYIIHHVTVKKECCIKGKLDSQQFILALHIGGVKGFDQLPTVKQKYVLFLTPGKSKGQYKLAYPKAMAVFVGQPHNN